MARWTSLRTGGGQLTWLTIGLVAFCAVGWGAPASGTPESPWRCLCPGRLLQPPPLAGREGAVIGTLPCALCWCLGASGRGLWLCLGAC